MSSSLRERLTIIFNLLLNDVFNALPHLSLAISVFSFVIGITNYNAQCNTDLRLSLLITSLFYFLSFLAVVIRGLCCKNLIFVLLTFANLGIWITSGFMLSQTDKSECEATLYDLTLSIFFVPLGLICICFLLFIFCVMVPDKQEEEDDVYETAPGEAELV